MTRVAGIEHVPVPAIRPKGGILIAWFLFLALLRFLLLDTDPSDADEGAEDGDDDGAEGEPPEPIKDPEAKVRSLTEANARLARKAKKLAKRVEELERGTSNGGQALRSAKLEAAFLRAVMNSEQRIADLEDAWDLASAKGLLDVVKITDEGQVEGMDGAIEKLVTRYPWLVDDAEAEPPPPSTPKPKVRPVIRDKEKRSGLDRKTLEKRFGALRRGHH